MILTTCSASYAIYGTPTPTAVVKTVQVEMSSRYNNAVSLASQQLENAKSQLSILASGTPQPAYQTLLSGFEKAYSDSGLGEGKGGKVVLVEADMQKVEDIDSVFDKVEGLQVDM